MAFGLVPALENEVVENLGDALPLLKETNPFKQISEGLIEGGADVLYLQINKFHGWSDENLYKKWLHFAKDNVHIDSSRALYMSLDGRFSEQLINFHIEASDLRKKISGNEKNLPVLENPHASMKALLKYIAKKEKEGKISKLVKKVTRAERFPLVVRTTISASKKKKGPEEHFENVDFRYEKGTLPEKVAWDFSHAIVIPMEYSWIGYLLAKNHEVGSVGFYSDKPKTPNNAISYELFSSCWKQLFGTKRYHTVLQFSEMPKEIPGRVKDIANKLGVYSVIKGDTRYGRSAYAKKEGSSLTVHPRSVWEYGKRDGESPAMVSMNGKGDTLDKTIFQLFSSVCDLLKERNVEVHHNARMKEILNRKYDRDSHYDNYASLLLHQI